MDLLAKRWANPFSVLDEFIRLGRLHGFLNETLKRIAEEKITQNRWDYYLHVVTRTSDISFEEYVKYCEEHKHGNSKEMTTEQIGDVISDSKNMLDSFK